MSSYNISRYCQLPFTWNKLPKKFLREWWCLALIGDRHISTPIVGELDTILKPEKDPTILYPIQVMDKTTNI